jgi:hypothetical protein
MEMAIMSFIVLCAFGALFEKLGSNYEKARQELD